MNLQPHENPWEGDKNSEVIQVNYRYWNLTKQNLNRTIPYLMVLPQNGLLVPAIIHIFNVVWCWYSVPSKILTYIFNTNKISHHLADPKSYGQTKRWTMWIPSTTSIQGVCHQFCLGPTFWVAVSHLPGHYRIVLAAISLDLCSHQ